MRVKNRDLILLNDIYECLMMHKEVKEAQGLDELLSADDTMCNEKKH